MTRAARAAPKPFFLNDFAGRVRTSFLQDAVYGASPPARRHYMGGRDSGASFPRPLVLSEAFAEDGDNSRFPKRSGNGKCHRFVAPWIPGSRRGEGDMRTTRRLRSIAFLVAVLVSTGGAALAQTGATTVDLAGTVFDATKAVLAGATVTATNLATGVERAAVSGRDGRYAIPALPPGAYRVKAELPGFVPQLFESVPLALGEAAEIPFALKAGGPAETVTVAGATPLLHPRRTAVSAVISQQQIDVLPTNGRNFIGFSVLTAGVDTDRTPYQGAVSTSGLTFAGQRARSNNVTVDGLDNNDITVGAVRATFSQEAVREFQVVANSYSAEFGKASGGVVNIVTKSGGNQLSGNAFVYVRDDALNAMEHFEKYDPAGNRLDQEKAPYSRYQFGGTFGGPIRRDRAFFFASAEWLRSQANNFVNIDDDNNIEAFGISYGSTVDVLRQAGFPIELGQLPYRVDSDQVFGRVDIEAPAHRLALRFNWSDALDENAERWGGQIAKSRGAAQESRDVMGTASLTSFFSPRLMNELRFQVAYRDQNILSFDPKCSPSCEGVDEGGPTVEVGAVAVGRQRFTPQPRTDVRYQVVDTITRDAGRHQLKAGLDLSYIDMRRQSLPLHFGGRYVFQALTASQAGQPGNVDAEQALAIGIPNSYVQGYGDPTALGPYGDVSLFAEDQWRAASRLTLKLGVRYQNQFWPEMTVNVPDLPPYGWPTDNNNVAPRLAVSWEPTGDGKTFVHGAYGIFYDNHITSLWGLATGISGTPEYVRTVNLPRQLAAQAWRTSSKKYSEPDWFAPPYYLFPAFAYTVQPEMDTPYAHHASVGVDRELTAGMTMSANVVFVRGFNQVGNIEYNPVTNVPQQGSRPLDVNGVPRTSGLWRQFTAWGESWYRGVTLSLSRRYAGGYGLLASYTWSKAEDLMADFGFQQPQDVGAGRNPDDPSGLPLGFDPYAERGPSLQDQRHRFVFSGSYELPWDVTLSGIVTIGSGRPFNILAGEDLNRNGDSPSADRPRLVETDAATSISRNTGLMPATSSVDVRVAKRVALGARARLDLMFEMFNLFNRTNYTQVDNICGKTYPCTITSFGQFTEAGPPFQAQLAARLSFGAPRAAVR